MGRKLLSWSGLIIAVALLLAINIFSAAALRKSRIDLTEQKLYTLSEGTKNILGSIDEPITLKLYYSRSLAQKELPPLDTFATRVKELLEEYRDLSNGKLNLEIIEPLPFSKEEDEAALAGLQGIPISAAGDTMFLGLVGVNSVDEKKVLPLLQPSKEQFLEYDLTQLVFNLIHPKKKVVGLISTLPVLGDNDLLAQLKSAHQLKQPWLSMEELRKSYTVRDLEKDVTDIADDVDILLVIHPKDLPKPTLYAIDQFVLKGGRAIVFVDPYCEADDPPEDPQNPYAGLWESRQSNPAELFKAWGIEMVKDKFVGDRKLARSIPTRNERGVVEYTPFVAYMGLSGEDGCYNEDEVTMNELGEINIGTAGSLRKLEDGTTEVKMLMQTTPESNTINVNEIKFNLDAKDLLKKFVSDDDPKLLGVHVTGPVKTAFPNGKLGESESAEATRKPDHLEESTEDINVMVFSDVDFLTDRFWVQVQEMMGRRMGYPFAVNDKVLLNSVEYLSGSQELISVRSRTLKPRTFKRIEDIQQAAETKFRERESELNDKLDDVEKRINEIQQNRTDATGAVLTLNDEQKEALEEAKQEMADTRTQLRDVRFQMEKEIKDLETKIKLFNVGAIPIIISIFAIILGIIRINRRRA